MSFILDALRKSEHERQRRAGPAIADIAIVQRRSGTPLILSIVGVLLLINLVVAAYFLMRDETPAAAAIAAPGPVRTPDPEIAVHQADDAAPAVEPTAVVRSLAAEAGPSGPPAAADAAPPPAPDPLLLPPAPHATAQQPTPRPRPAADGTTDFVPRLDTLPPQVTSGLPVLNLDLHIFATNPAQRAVFINGRRYQEGDSLPEGVDVVAITTEGAVLRHRGQRFLLPRP